MRAARWTVFGVFLVVTFVGTIGSQVVVNVTTGDPDDNTTQNETSIAVSGSVVVIGWNDATQLLGPNVSWTGYGYSTDGGATWTDAGTLAPVAGGQNSGDPVLASDSAGNFYFATLASNAAGARFIGVARSTATSPAVTFGIPVLITGSNSLFLQDKPWLAVDATGGTYDGRVYVCWKDFSDFSIRFVRSTSTTPLTFGASQVLSASGQGCMIAVGPAGEVHVTWLTGMGTLNQAIHIRKSTDGGNNFGADTTVATFARTGDATASSSLNCGRRALDGNVRVADFPAIAVDRSGGSFNGSVYIVFSGDFDGGGPDEAEVLFTRSPANPAAPAPGDPGVTWSTPISINKTPAVVLNADGTNNDNWLSAIAVANNGTIEAMFYDRRNDTSATDGDPANMKIDVFKAISTDGGTNWRNKKVTSAPFGIPQLLPNFNPLTAKCYMGDYNQIAASGPDFFLAWGDNSNVVTTAGFPAGRPDPDVVYASEGGLCDLFPTLRQCLLLPAKNLFTEGILLRFDIIERVWVEPIEKECWYKFTCPGCAPGQLCPPYTLIFDFKQAGLDPEAVRIQLLDFDGREIAPEKIIDGRKFLSFRPKSFREGGVGEKIFLLFKLGPKGNPKTTYKIPVQLQVGDKSPGENF